LDLLHKKKAWESVIWQVSHVTSHVRKSQVISHDASHDRCGKIVHRPCSSYISSIQEIEEDSIKFSLSTQTWSRFKLPWLEPYTKLSQPAILSKACPSCICYSSLDWVLGIFCVLLKISYWLQTLILIRFVFYHSRGSDDGDKCQEVPSLYPCSSDTILKLLQMSETQR